jgi:hypothetical protein
MEHNHFAPVNGLFNQRIQGFKLAGSGGEDDVCLTLFPYSCIDKIRCHATRLFT